MEQPCSKTVVRSASVYSASLQRRLPWYSPLRLDGTPFLLVYSVVLFYIVEAMRLSTLFAEMHLEAGTEASKAGELHGDAVLPAAATASGSILDVLSIYGICLVALLISLIAFHVFLSLSCLWSISARCFVRFKSASMDEVRSCDSIIVKATATSPWELCTLHRQPICGLWGFNFQRRRFVFDANQQCFVELDFPSSHAVSHYTSSKGLGHDDENMFLLRCKYGLNEFEVPLPSFWTLFAEHATAPFFVFQMLCVGLWLLDEYWYYSLLTLFMLVVFEMSVVKRRLVSLEQVRSMRAPPYNVMVYRNRHWRSVSTKELLPGDLISLCRSQSSAHTAPCDMLLLQGSCVVDESLLTGESVPQLKEPLSVESGSTTTPLDMDGLNKSSVIYGGTEVIVHSNEPSPATGTNIRRASDGGCIAYVVRTGFHTTQGRLVSTILCSTERVTVNNAESFVFIFILLVFALVAAAYVLVNSWDDPNRSRYKLVLNCIMIVTSVVPPELPMELSLAVNTSLAQLMSKRIFCTEPFRIPFAGAVDTICFDKTGTLTADAFVFSGLAGLVPDSIHELIDAVNAPLSSKQVIAACHSLVYLDGGLIGDPLEKAALQSLRWNAAGGGAGITSVRGEGHNLKIHRRFPFCSALKRMLCVVTNASDEVFVVCKGAPEVLQSLLSSSPPEYNRTHQHFSRRGNRVLALAYKRLEGVKVSHIAQLDRDELESALDFAGFMVLHSPIKESSPSTVLALKNSSHRVMMITGDHALTACEVARVLQITSESRTTLILSVIDGIDLRWISVNDEAEFVAFDVVGPLPDAAQYDLCVTGPALEVVDDERFTQLAERVKVFARVSPEQKQAVLARLKERGHVTLMCGDGTNDVGALKQAHVGVALLAPAKEHSGRVSAGKNQKEKKKKKTSSPDKAALRQRRPPANKPRNLTLRERWQAEMKKHEDAAGAEEAPLVELGDASVAAPFTCKRSEVDSCLDIVRQGRCTLVTTMQMYQILALQCLISAYGLSVLYLDGVKLGDTQMTITGLFVATMFLFISRAKPLIELSAERPESSVFTLRMFLSLVGQFAMHIGTLILAVKWSQPFTPTDEVTRDPDGDFAPNVLNTVVFLVSSSTTLATFAANYKGRPFMQSLRENTALFRCIVVCILGVICCALEVSPDFNEFLELHTLPDETFRHQLALLMIADLFASVSYEALLNYIFLRRSRISID